MSGIQAAGSWAGAMGQCQFMPSTYLHYAVSADGGSPDIWDNIGDVFASIANYILADGWDGEQKWGQEVMAGASDFRMSKSDLSHDTLFVRMEPVWAYV